MRPQSTRAAASPSAAKDHGTRAGYASGCPCLPCRAANSRYESERRTAMKQNGAAVVPADTARNHILRLSRKSVGLRAISAATDIGFETLQHIWSGLRAHIRKTNEKKILAVDRKAVFDHALVPAARTWRQINQLVEEGFNKGDIAKRIGSLAGLHKLGKEKMLAITASRVERLYSQFIY